MEQGSWKGEVQVAVSFWGKCLPVDELESGPKVTAAVIGPEGRYIRLHVR